MSGPAVEISRSGTLAAAWPRPIGRSRPTASGSACLRAGCRGAGHRPRSSPPPSCIASQPASPTRSAIAPIAKSPTCSAGCGLRADDICGAHVSRTADLFGTAPDLPAWKSLTAPLDRLAAFAADADNPPPDGAKRTARSALFRRRAEERTAASRTVATAPAADRHAAAGAGRLGPCRNDAAVAGTLMSLALHDCSASGPALPESFLRFELAARAGQTRPAAEARTPFEQGWDTVRRQVRALGGAGGPLRVANHIIAPLAPCLGYGAPQRQEPSGDPRRHGRRRLVDAGAGRRAAARMVGRHRQRPGRAASQRPRLSFQPDTQRVARAAVSGRTGRAADRRHRTAPAAVRSCTSRQPFRHSADRHGGLARTKPGAGFVSRAAGVGGAARACGVAGHLWKRRG